jgi:hypothetical protein
MLSRKYNPLMFGYGIGRILPLIRCLKNTFHEAKQPWYANKAGAGGSFLNLCRFFSWLQEIGPFYDYFPEPSKIILHVQEHNQTIAKSAFTEFDFKVRSGSRYFLGDFIGSSDDQMMWIEAKVVDCTSAIADVAFIVISHPQSAYAGLQKSLLQEWQFVQREVKGIDADFSEIKKSITDLFLPSLFAGQFEESHPYRNLSKLLRSLLAWPYLTRPPPLDPTSRLAP